MISIFFGRIAINVDTFVRIGNAMPGARGVDLAQQLLGFVPHELPTDDAWRRYPVVLTKFPRVFLRIPRRAAQLRGDTERWYRSVIDGVAALDLDAARTLYLEARARFDEAVYVQILTTTIGIQPIFEQLTALGRRAGVDPSALMGGHGSHAESELVQHLWDCSRGKVSLDDVVARFGYHGPGEGQISGRSWRQDRAPLERVLATYRSMPDDREPTREGARRTVERHRIEAELLASVPRIRRPGARLVLRLAERYLPLRGGCKVAFLQSLDVCRAAAVRIGEILAARGALSASDDAFFLTSDELLGALPTAAGALVCERRSEYERYLQFDLPVAWRGDPEPVSPEASIEPVATLTGTGVSGGRAAGPARVVLDPAAVDMEVGDVLVARTTDPSWASVMYPAAALVVEVGGQLSHAAVVARELGIPCVMGVSGAVTTIPDRARVRVDGTAGTVEVEVAEVGV
jgi:pyruvate,water dikinase